MPLDHFEEKQIQSILTEKNNISYQYNGSKKKRIKKKKINNGKRKQGLVVLIFQDFILPIMISSYRKKWKQS